MMFVFVNFVLSACRIREPESVVTQGDCPATPGAAHETKFDDGRPGLPEGIACLAWPIGAYRTISSSFRDPDHPFVPGKHSGTDIASPVGIPVTASAGGVVDWIRAVAHCQDATVGVRFGADWVYEAHHLSRVDVTRGQVVVVGQRLGLSGGRVGDPGSGQWTTGPHLHFGMLHEGTYVNASNYLCP
jgi:murein DD-endopeptidase MepM/ murein hydrolase activator NlpD